MIYNNLIYILKINNIFMFLTFSHVGYFYFRWVFRFRGQETGNLRLRHKTTG